MMPYCEAVINETMRLYPPAPTVMRYADRDVKLGKKYAIHVLKTILIHCIRDYEIIAEPNENLEFKVDIALRTISGHLIQVKRRQ
ncbi:unnamed protein product [Leptidea sinapis]|uniref:Cytochrome P450 n=1 Tax=Leptidea sinapis TaxID=189913 RepID=A0A5E4PS06_9NEOP|nr:unnamed protein product [Leptidea sinapis]